MTISQSNFTSINSGELTPLRKLQLVELGMLKAVIDMLRRNSVRYYLGFGSLLGAVRHQGFIPWDDDVDIFIPRPDFEKIKLFIDSELPDPYKAYFFLPGKHSVNTGVNLRVENPKIKVWQERAGARCARNVWIDLFPLDGIPGNQFIQTLQFARFRLLFIELRLSRSLSEGTEQTKARPLIERIGIGINRVFKLGKLFPLERVLAKFDKVRMRYDYEQSECVYPLTLDYMEKCICRKEWFGEGVEALFEGERFTVPSNYDAVLRSFYGDYMTPPPVEQRTLKHRIEFEDESGV